MTMPVRTLAVVQNWDCHACTRCCRQYHVPVTAEERARIEAQGWSQDPDFAGVPLFVRSGGWMSSDYRLNHLKDGTCVFLGPDNRCRIHTKFGGETKPLACRNYPFSLVPAGDHWNLGLRFACPSVAGNEGRPLGEHLPDARRYAGELEAQAKGKVSMPAPPLQKNYQVPWADLSRIQKSLAQLFTDTEVSMELRWRRVLFVIDILRGSTLGREKNPKKIVTGGRLGELLELLIDTAEKETPHSPSPLLPPTGLSRLVFRLLAAFSAREDIGADRGPAQASLLGRASVAARFTRGRGKIPQTRAGIAGTFEDAEQPLGEISPASAALLARWARVKIESGQFCGPIHYGMTFWDGLESLALAFATSMWLARVLKAGGKTADEAVMSAVRIVDDTFGYNPLLGKRLLTGLKLLALRRGELARLVAWYGR